MPIINLDGVLAGARPPFDLLKVGGTMEAAGVLHSLFYSSGSPGAGSAPANSLSGAALTPALAGSIPWSNPAVGFSYLSRLSASATAAGKLILCDRLWHNGSIGITTTTAQTVNSVQFPARCPPASGEVPDSDGRCIMVGLEASAAIGGGAVTNTTLSYTNSAGTAGRTATMASWPATAAAGTFVPFQLQSGDIGVRSVQSLTLGTTYTSGTVHLVAYRKLAELPMPLANSGFAIDAITSGFPRLFDDSTLFLLWHASGTAAVTVNGVVAVTQG